MKLIVLLGLKSYTTKKQRQASGSDSQGTHQIIKCVPCVQSMLLQIKVSTEAKVPLFAKNVKLIL